MLDEDTSARDWRDAIANEHHEIHVRRAAAFAGGKHQQPPDDKENGTVGLALSGGGVRSAAFNLGLIQSLHRSGLLRWFDYLSCVSGGSYVGAMVTEAIHRRREYGKEAFDLAVGPDGKQPRVVHKVSSRGNSLFRIDLMANRYAIGLLLNLIPIISSLVAFGAGVAWLWRLLDTYTVRDLFAGLGFNNDYVPAMAPAFAAFIVWGGLHTLALLVRSEPLRKATHVLFWLAIACLVIGVTLLLGNGDVTLQIQSPSLAGEGESRARLSSLLYWGALIVGSLGLVPVFLPKAWLRSGQNPRNAIESWMFYYTSLALFLGIPLLSIGWFARENVSKYAYFRGPELRDGDVVNMGAFCSILRMGQSPPERSSGNLPHLRVEFKSGDGKKRIPDGLVADLRVKSPSASAPASSLINTVETVTAKYTGALHDLGLDSAFPSTNPLERGSISTAGAVRDPEWFRWRYAKLPWRLSQALVAIVDHEQTNGQYENQFAQFVATAAEKRAAERRLLDAFNSQLTAAGSDPLFQFAVLNAPPSADSQKPADAASPANTSNAGVAAAPMVVQLQAEKLPNQVVNMLIELAAQSNGLPHASNERAAPQTTLADEQKRGELNRALLEAAFPKVFRPRSEIRRVAVIEYDQMHRGFWFLMATAVCLVSSFCISPNRTSLHDWYRDRLSMTYLAFDDARDEPFPEDRSSPLHELRSHTHGGPFPLFVAASSVDSWWRHAQQLAPKFRPYVMTPLSCGSRELGVRPTDDGDALSRTTVADTMAISAAALSPNYFVHHIVMAMMSLLNFRLGRWLPNPRTPGRRSSNPTTGVLMTDEFLSNKPVTATRDAPAAPVKNRRYLLVTDGGHCENLGIEALLERRCRVIIASDSGADPHYTFDDFTRLQRRYEALTGVRFVELASDDPLRCIDRLPLRPLSKEVAAEVAEFGHAASATVPASTAVPQETPQRHYFVGRFRYPDAAPGYEYGLLVYIKPCMTGDEDLVIQNFTSKSAAFPHEPTSDQAFSYEKFEAYRHLGYHTGEDLSRGYDGLRNAQDLWQAGEWWGLNDFVEHFTGPKTKPPEPAAAGGPSAEMRTGGNDRTPILLQQLRDANGSQAHQILSELHSLGAQDPAALRLILRDVIHSPDFRGSLTDMNAAQSAGWFRHLVRIATTSSDPDSANAASYLVDFVACEPLEIADIEAHLGDLETSARDASGSTEIRLLVIRALSRMAHDHFDVRDRIVNTLKRIREQDSAGGRVHSVVTQILAGLAANPPAQLNGNSGGNGNGKNGKSGKKGGHATRK